MKMWHIWLYFISEFNRSKRNNLFAFNEYSMRIIKMIKNSLILGNITGAVSALLRLNHPLINEMQGHYH